MFLIIGLLFVSLTASANVEEQLSQECDRLFAKKARALQLNDDLEREFYSQDHVLHIEISRSFPSTRNRMEEYRLIIACNEHTGRPEGPFLAIPERLVDDFIVGSYKLAPISSFSYSLNEHAFQERGLEQISFKWVSEIDKKEVIGKDNVAVMSGNLLCEIDLKHLDGDQGVKSCERTFPATSPSVSPGKGPNIIQVSYPFKYNAFFKNGSELLDIFNRKYQILGNVRIEGHKEVLKSIVNYRELRVGFVNRKYLISHPDLALGMGELINNYFKEMKINKCIDLDDSPWIYNVIDMADLPTLSTLNWIELMEWMQKQVDQQ